MKTDENMNLIGQEHMRQAKAFKAQQAQHSPLPWKIMADPSYPEGLHPLHHHRYIATEAMGVEGDDFDGEGLLICAMRDLATQEADARLIVRAVNHADKLAEALQAIVKWSKGLPYKADGMMINFQPIQNAADALAAYETDQ